MKEAVALSLEGSQRLMNSGAGKGEVVDNEDREKVQRDGRCGNNTSKGWLGHD